MNRYPFVLACALLFAALFQPPNFGQPLEEPPGGGEKSVSVENEKRAGAQTTQNSGDRDSNGGYEIVITATKTGINKKETGASITVITAEDIERKKIMNVVDLLKDVPGASVSQSSPLGGLADLYLRGTASNHTVVLIDGIKVNDPSSAGHGFDFANLTADNIERIEIIRGSQSTLYGSDAIGGVINIITKKGRGTPQIAAQVEGGSFYTFKESAGVSGGNEWAYYSFNASRTDSRGFQRTSSWRGVRKSFLSNQHDGYDNTSVSTRVGVKTIHDSWLSFALRYTDAGMKIADSSYQEDKNHTYRNENLALNLTYEVPVFEWWESTLFFSYMNQLLRDKDLPDLHEFVSSDIFSGGFGTFGYSDMTFSGKIMNGEFRNKFMISDIDEILCGVSYEKEYVKTVPYWAIWNQFFTSIMEPTSPIDKNTGTWAAYAQNHLKLLKRIFLITGVRYTEPYHFRSSIDYSVSVSIILPVTETRLKANTGTGYKVPSLYQLYNTFERYDRFTYAYLKPERSVSYDAGIEQPLWKDRIVLEANYFAIDYKNMIMYDTIADSWGRYYNSNAYSRGVECITSLKPTGDLAISAYYTYTHTVNTTFHSGDMVRRPRHKAGVTVNYAFLKKGNINLGFAYTGRRRDYAWTYPFESYMNPYYKLDAAVSWWIIDQLQIFLRGENLLNKKYEEVRGYRTPMFSLYGGLKAVI
jgi:vitamin B12 transporter